MVIGRFSDIVRLGMSLILGERDHTKVIALLFPGCMSAEIGNGWVSSKRHDHVIAIEPLAIHLFDRNSRPFANCASFLRKEAGDIEECSRVGVGSASPDT